MEELFFYHKKPTDKIWWVDNSAYEQGAHEFSFDRKKNFNLFRDYPYKLSKEQIELFEEENPFWANFFADRKKH